MQTATFLSQLALQCCPATTLLAQGVCEVADYLSLTQSTKAERTEHLGSTLQRQNILLQKRKRVRHIAAMNNNTQRPTGANLPSSTSSAVSTRINSSSTSPRHRERDEREGRIDQVQSVSSSLNFSPLCFLKAKARFLRYKLSTQHNVETLRGELLSFLEELQKSEIEVPQSSSSPSLSLSSPLLPFVHNNVSSTPTPTERHLASIQSLARSSLLPTIQSIRSRERKASVDLSNVPLNVQQRVHAILMEDLSAMPSDNLCQGYVQRVQEGDNNP